MQPSAIIADISTPKNWLEAITNMRLLTIEDANEEVQLRQKSTTVKVFGRELAQFCEALIEQMLREKGIGLAAPQMGVFQRIYVSQVDEKKPPLVAINPVITPAAQLREYGEEGCLSVPGIAADIERWAAIDVRMQDPYGKTVTLHLEGLDAVCFQHENDHLEGVLFIDYLSRSQLRKLRKQLAKQQKNAAPSTGSGK